MSIKEVKEILIRDLEVGVSQDAFDQETFLAAIEQRVAELMDSDPSLLMSYLYRLDVAEEKIKIIMASEKSISQELAKLILDRQIERVRTKTTIKQKPIEGWDW